MEVSPYKGLNCLTCKDRYPIPLRTDLLDAPKGAQYYTKIDLRSTYHLVHIAVMPQVNFPWKITFDMLYTNRFLIRIHSRTLFISSEHNTI